MKLGPGGRRIITDQMKEEIRKWSREGRKPKEINMGLHLKYGIQLHPSTIWKVIHREYHTDR